MGHRRGCVLLERMLGWLSRQRDDPAGVPCRSRPTGLALRVRPVPRDRTALATPAALSCTRAGSTSWVRANEQAKTRPGRGEGVRTTREAEGGSSREGITWGWSVRGGDRPHALAGADRHSSSPQKVLQSCMYSLLSCDTRPADKPYLSATSSVRSPCRRSSMIRRSRSLRLQTHKGKSRRKTTCSGTGVFVLSRRRSSKLSWAC